MTRRILVAVSPESADPGPVNVAVAAGRFTGAPLVLLTVGGDAAAGASLESELSSRGVTATVRAEENGSPARAWRPSWSSVPSTPKRSRRA